MRYPYNTFPLRRNNRSTTGVSFLFVFLFMWILFGWNTGNADYDNYQYIYNSFSYYGSYTAVEIGFQFLCRIGNAIGLSYNGFLVIYSFIGLSLIVSTARKYTNNYTLMIVLYFIYPFLLDVVQIRNFMSMALITFATRYLVTNEKKDCLKYIILVLLACTFHYSAIFYMLFLLVRIKSYMKLTLVTLALMTIGFITQSVLPNLVYHYLKSERYEAYFTYSTSFYAKFVFIIYFAASVALTVFVYRRIKNGWSQGILNEYENKSGGQIAFADVVMKINIIICAVYVLVLIDVDFIRLFRNILPLNYILFSMIKPKNKFTKNVYVQVHNLCFIAFVALSSWAFIFFTTYQSVVYPIFNNNIILDYFK